MLAFRNIWPQLHCSLCLKLILLWQCFLLWFQLEQTDFIPKNLSFHTDGETQVWCTSICSPSRAFMFQVLLFSPKCLVKHSSHKKSFIAQICTRSIVLLLFLILVCLVTTISWCWVQWLRQELVWTGFDWKDDTTLCHEDMGANLPLGGCWTSDTTGHNS